MPVTDMEFLPDGSMVFTTGGRGTASGLYRVSYVGAGKNESATQSENPAIVTTKEGSAIANRLGEIFGTPSSVRRQFHDALTYGSNNGMGNPREYARKISEWLSSGSGWLRYATMVGLEIEHQSYRHISPELGPPFLPMTRAGAPEIAIFAALGLSRSDALETQSVTIETLKRFPLATLSDDLKLLKLRVLEVSFARQGRPSAEVVKALVEELSRQYPAKGEPPHGAPPVPAATTPDGKAALPNDATKAGVEKVGAARGSDVAGGDARRSMLNRELSQLLIWLTNPELGELNADLIEKAKASAPGAAPTAPSPAGGKTGDFRPADGAAGQPDGLKAQNSRFSAQKAAFSGAAGDSTTARDDFLGALDRSATARDRSATARDHSATARDHSATARDRSTTTRDHSTTARDRSTTARDRSTTPRDDSTTPRDDSTTPRDDSAAPGNRSATPGHRVSETTGQAFAQAQPLSAKAPADPEKEGTPGGAGAPRTLPASASDRKDGKRATERGFHLGPVPNPGASIFPGRKGAPDDGALAAAGREVIEKTLALMEAAPSQEEQIQYALALRWAHGWSPEQRVRYFRWFHEKAARYTGGNSFAKFVEAIR
ncbi:MAG: hypothetical protein ABIP85_27840, partial [Chthoniobacteraceae bacterium]